MIVNFIPNTHCLCRNCHIGPTFVAALPALKKEDREIFDNKELVRCGGQGELQHSEDVYNPVLSATICGLGQENWFGFPEAVVN